MADILKLRSDGPGAPDVETQQKFVSKAEKAMKRGGFKEAVDYLKKALVIAPGEKKTQTLLETATLENKRAQAQAHLRRGRYARSSGENDQAMWHFKQALSSEKENLDARHFIAEIYVEQEQKLDKALAYMREIIVLGGQRSRYFVTLGNIFLLTKEVDRAADAFNKALTMEPNNKDIKKRLRLCKK